MATYRDKHKDHTIKVETEQVGDPVLRQFRVSSIEIQCDGQEIAYAMPEYEGRVEASMVAKAIANAKVFIERLAP